MNGKTSKSSGTKADKISDEHMDGVTAAVGGEFVFVTKNQFYEILNGGSVTLEGGRVINGYQEYVNFLTEERTKRGISYQTRIVPND